MNNFVNSANHQKLQKLDLSDSFTSNFSEGPLLCEDIRSMVNQLYSTLIQAKLLPKHYPRPEASMESLNFLVNTLCDEFLLEVDGPNTETHCSSGRNQRVTWGDEEECGEQNEDLILKIFNAKSSVRLSEKECRDLTAMIIEMARQSKSGGLQKQKVKFEEKLIGYGEEIIRCKKVLKAKEAEVVELRKQVENLREERESMKKTATPDSLKWDRYDRSSEDNDF